MVCLQVDLDTYTPACLAQTSDTDNFYGKSAWVYGWGRTTNNPGSTSSTLLEVFFYWENECKRNIINELSVPVVTPSECAVTMGTREDGQLCAGGEAGKDSCGVSGEHERDSDNLIYQGRQRRSSHIREWWPTYSHRRGQLWIWGLCQGMDWEFIQIIIHVMYDL